MDNKLIAMLTLLAHELRTDGSRQMENVVKDAINKITKLNKENSELKDKVHCLIHGLEIDL